MFFPKRLANFHSCRILFQPINVTAIISTVVKNPHVRIILGHMNIH